MWRSSIHLCPARSRVRICGELRLKPLNLSSSSASHLANSRLCKSTSAISLVLFPLLILASAKSSACLPASPAADPLQLALTDLSPTYCLWFLLPIILSCQPRHTQPSDSLNITERCRLSGSFPKERPTSITCVLRSPVHLEVTASIALISKYIASGRLRKIVSLRA